MTISNIFEGFLGAPEICVAGVDEAGRGPLAGPVLAGAVILKGPTSAPSSFHPLLADSKSLTPPQRNKVYQWICSHALAFAVGRASVEEINHNNILQASLMAMKRAIEALSITPKIVLIDGIHIPKAMSLECYSLVGGDRRSYSVAAASILAKVERDRFMIRMDTRYPGYHFARNKGYPTTMHRRALATLGPCPIHRGSFKGVHFDHP